MKRIFALFFAIVLILGLFAGCGKNAAANDSAVGSADGNRGEIMEETASESLADSSKTNSNLPQGQKLVRKLWVDAETEDLDSLLVDLETAISQAGGYVEARQVYHGSANASRRYRNADMTLRIPADKVDAFLKGICGMSNIISSRETVDDITLTYVATQSRITALETEQAQLLELLSKAENMSDLLKIKSQLTEVRAELESITSKLLVYDNQVNYGTIYLNISEVKEYTDTQEPETPWQRISSGFMTNLKDLGNGIVEVFIWFIASLPYLIPLGLVTTLVVILIKKKAKKSKQAKTETE